MCVPVGHCPTSQTLESSTTTLISCSVLISTQYLLFLSDDLLKASFAKIFCHQKECSKSFLIFYKFIYLFIYLWLRWVFVATRGLSLVAVSGGYSSWRCVGFSLQWLLLLQSKGSRRSGFSGCGTWAQ